MAEKRRRILRKTTLRLDQNESHPLYLLSLTPEEITAVADITRLDRGASGKLLGYQRGEVSRHIRDIVTSLNSDDILFPNSLILAFSSQVTFCTLRIAEERDALATVGTLAIPLPRKGETKPGWIVDGQQRAKALMQSKR